MELLIPKKTGTYADALCAVGYASLFAEVRESSARISDIGYAYRVSSEKGNPPDAWKSPSPGFKYIWRQSDEARPPGANVIDYDAEKAIAEALRKTSASSRARKQVTAALEELSDAPAAANDPEYRFTAIIESMRKGWSSDKALYRWIHEQNEPCLAAVRKRLLGEDQHPFDVDWSNSQILNPSTGKGIHAAKTVAKSASGFKLVDTFDEWMKLRGLWVSMLGFRSGDDFKLFVLDPGDISTGHLQKLRTELRDLGMWGVVRLDVEAVLRLLQSLMLHSEFRESSGIPVLKRRPNRIIAGLHLAFFKSLGTAAALMNDSQLPLPGWFTIEGPEDVEAYLAICQEPYGATKGEYGPLSALRDDRSDDVALLQQYRRWLTTGLLADLLAFHASFAARLLRKLAGNEFSPAFQETVLHLLLQKGYPEVKEIIDSPGFQNVARAIRNTTIYAAGMKNSNREIRFGLAQKLKQRIKAGKREFLAEISDFVQQQNWEVVHRLNGAGFQVETSDLDDIIRLTEKYDAELVGMLLLAYGFSRAEAVAKKDGSNSGHTELAQ